MGRLRHRVVRVVGVPLRRQVVAALAACPERSPEPCPERSRRGSRRAAEGLKGVLTVPAAFWCKPGYRAEEVFGTEARINATSSPTCWRRMS